MPTGPGLRLSAREADDKPVVNRQALDRCYECDRCACARSRDGLLLPILKALASEIRSLHAAESTVLPVITP